MFFEQLDHEGFIEPREHGGAGCILLVTAEENERARRRAYVSTVHPCQRTPCVFIGMCGGATPGTRIAGYAAGVGGTGRGWVCRGRYRVIPGCLIITVTGTGPGGIIGMSGGNSRPRPGTCNVPLRRISETTVNMG